MMRPHPDRATGAPRARASGPRTRTLAAAALLSLAGLAATGAEVTGVDLISNPGDDGKYTPGETPDEMLVEVTFDENVAVTGSPSFILMVGDQRKTMAYQDGAGGQMLYFAYTVQTGDLDLDGVSHPANALRGRIINNDDGEAADTSFAAKHYADHPVDGVAPRIAGRAQVVSTPAKAGTYATEETIRIQVPFDEALGKVEGIGLALFFGGREVPTGVPSIIQADTDTIEFVYAVASGDLDENGFALGPTRLAVTDSVGNTHDQTIARVQTQQKVDGVPPRIIGTPRIVSRPRAGNTYAAGEDIEIEVRFSEAVYEAAGATFTVQIGEADRPAAYAGGDGTERLRFRYEVQTVDVDADGIKWAADALDGEDLVDLVDQGIDASATVVPVAAQTAHRVDGGDDDNEAPVVTDVAIVSEPNMAGAYSEGQEIVVGVTFSEAVDVTDGSPALELSLGEGTATAVFDRESRRKRQLLFKYEVSTNDEDLDGVAVGPIADTLVGGTIEDLSGNTAVRAFPSLPDQSAHRVDGVAPTVVRAAVTSAPEAGETFGAGESIEVTVEFSEPVEAAHEPDLHLSLEIGTERREAHLASGDGTRSLVFRYRVRTGDMDVNDPDDPAADGVRLSASVFGGGHVRDLPGNRLAGDELCSDPERCDEPFDVDAQTTEPEVDVVSDVGEYAPGDSIVFEVEFNENIRVSGSPELVVLLGPSDGVKVRRRAQLVRQRPTLLTFSYRVQVDDFDDDGIDIPADALVGGTITDEIGNPFRTLMAPDGGTCGDATSGVECAQVTVDGIAPQTASIDIVSAPPSSRTPPTYRRGEPIEIAVRFTESVHLIEGEIALAVGIGGVVRLFPLADGLGTSTLTFRYIVADDDLDTDGISVPAGALRCDGGQADGGDADEEAPPDLLPCLGDAAGNTVMPPLVSIPAAPGHRVDGRARAPEARLAHGSAPASVGGYRAGEHIDVNLVFPAPVYVRGDPDLPGLMLSIGGEERRAGYVAGSGTATLRFRYTVVLGDIDRDGFSVAPGPGSLVGGLIVDDNDLAVPRDFDALGPIPGQSVDALIPTAIGAEIVSTPVGDDGYGLGEEIEVEVRFDERVSATDVEGLALVIEVGPRSRQAAYVDGSGTDTFRFAYRIEATDVDDDGVSIGPNAVVGGAIVDEAGNLWSDDQRRIPPVLPDDKHRVNPDVDLVAPTVERVEIVSAPTGTYLEDEVIEVAVTFSERVHVRGPDVPALSLSIGRAVRAADFAAGSGTATLAFRYAVQADDLDEDGISIGPGPDSLAGGEIEDDVGNAAIRDFQGLLADARHTVNVGVEPVTVAAVRIVSPAGVYGVGEPIEVEVEFSETVYVAGVPTIVLSVGDSDRDARYQTGSGSDTLTFRYAVTLGEIDDDGISIAANALQGGTITDSGGVDVMRGFAAVPRQAEHVVDATPTPLTRIEIVSRAGGDGIYGTGDTITVAATFKELVHVTGRPALTLLIGGAERSADYATGSGTPRLLFRYRVVEGDEDDDGISIAANALDGGTIESRGGVPALLDFEALGPFPLHRVSTVVVVPAVASVSVSSDAGDDTAYIQDDVIEIAVEFSETVHVTGDPVLALRVGANTRLAAFAAGSGTARLLFRYTVVEGDEDDDGISIAAGALAGGGIESDRGVAADLGFEALGPFPLHRVSTVVPAVASVFVSSDAGADTAYLPGDVIEIAVEFSETVHVTGDPVLALRVGANTREAAFAAGSGTTQLLFRYTVVDGDADDDGISIAAGALAGGEIESDSGVPADLGFDALAPQARHRVLNSVQLTTGQLNATVGQEVTLDLAAALATAGITYAGGFNAVSDAPSVVEVHTMANVLTVTARREGAANVTITAVLAPITLFLPVNVTASPEETAMLESSLAAVGRALLSSVSATVGTRLETPDAAPTSASPEWLRAGDDGLFAWPSADPLDPWHPGAGVDSRLPRQARQPGYRSLPQAFAMRLDPGSDPRGWAIWGAVDVQSFSGEPATGAYDGSLQSIHLGADVRGDGWVAGASASRSTAEVSYDLAGDEAQSGTLETELNAVYPYVRWTPAEGTIIWTVLGLGTGEAYHKRDGSDAPAADAPGELSMRLGLAGLKTRVATFGSVSLAMRGDVGFVHLDTDDGVPAVQGIAAAAQRVRAGVEASFPVAAGDGATLTPFLDIGGRWDGGDGETGGGAELAGGIRLKGPIGGAEVKGRSLIVPGTEGQAETGIAATAYLTPGGNRPGWRFALSPRWGDTATARDVMWQAGAALRPAAKRATAPGWTVGGELGRGFELRDRSALVTPFGEFDLGRNDTARRRIGVRYERNDAAFSVPLRVEFSGERVDQPGLGADNRVLITAQARR